MKSRNFISIVQLVLLISIQLVASENGDQAQQPRKSFDEWAFQYEPEHDPEQHKQILRGIVERAQQSGREISAFEVVAKIRNQNQQGEINEGLVYETKQRLYQTVEHAGCQVFTDSDYISLSGSVRNILYASVFCDGPHQYLQLVEDREFYSNVLHIRVTDRINNGIRDLPNFASDLVGEVIRGDEIPPPPPYTPDPVYPCADYTTSPWRNWFADAMHGGKINCEFLTDDCAYNKGRGGHLIMIDSGITTHPELDSLVASGRITKAHYFSPTEQGMTHIYEDKQGHGTSLAALAVGKYVGIVKQATLKSIKVTIDSDKNRLSINAVVAALNDIIAKQKSKKLANRLEPTVIFGGMTFIWGSQEECYGSYDSHPNNPNFRKRSSHNQSPRVNVLSPNLPYTINPPRPMINSRLGGYTYDCAYTVVEAIRTVIGYAIPYLVPSANGVEYWDPLTGDGPFASGFDGCFSARWLNAVADCMYDEYIYSPLFMTSGLRNDSRNPANAGRVNRGLIIGGYGKNFENARWYNVYDPNPNEENFFDMGGANYGSQWNMIYNGERCVDYAAPAANFENLPIVDGLSYGNWAFPGFTDGIVFGHYGIKEAPMSGVSYAVPLAAGSILETIIKEWKNIKPSAFWPDLTFGDKVINAVDNNNVITNPTYGTLTPTSDPAIVDMYSFFSYWVSHPAPLPYFTCAAKYGNYYTSDALASPAQFINTPYNRNLFMPKYGSSDPQCMSQNPQNPNM